MTQIAVDQTLLDLFREEVRGQVQALNQGLVAWEISANAAQIEPLMRAAHSIKGAARLVGVKPAAVLAHTMEDCLVAAQHGQLVISPVGMDLLLEGTDWLGQFAEAAGPDFDAWFAPHEVQVEQLLQRLQAVREGREPAPATDTPPPESPAPPAPAARETPPAEEEPVWTLFRQELRTNGEILCAGLTGPDLSSLDAERLASLVQAARNIRGVALLLPAEPVAELASAVEAVLQAARSGTPPAGDTWQALNESARLLAALADIPAGDFSAQAGRLAAFREQLLAPSTPAPRPSPPAPAAGPPPPVASAALPPAVEDRPAEPPAGAPRPATPLPPAVPEPSPAATAAPPPAVSPAVSAAAPESKDRVVRVAAQSLTRLMGLAGEALVESRWLHPFTQSLVKLKREQDRLADELNDLIQALPASDDGGALQTMADDVRQRLARCREALSARVLEFETHARGADDLNSRLYNEVIASRMRPFGDGVQGFPRMVRDIARQLHKKVRLEIAGEATAVDRDVLEKLDNPLNHLLRNAVDHGIETPEERVAAGKPETALLRLEARHLAGMLAIRISDDGRGIDPEHVRQRIVERGLTTADLAARMTEAELLEFLYLPGFSTRDQVSELSGRGVGLDVVHNMVHAVGGMVRVQTQLGRGTAFHLQLPITLSVIRAVLVEIAGETYAFPHHRIDRLLRVPQAEISSLEERQYFRVDGHNVGAVLASQVMRLHRVEYSEDLCVILFSSQADRYGLIVDKFLGEQDLVVRPLDPRIGKVPHVTAASVLDDGSPVLIADVEDIRRTLERMLDEEALERTDEEVPGVAEPQPKKRILVVDDSITVREVERQLLATRGYDVTVAVDGADGWNAVRDQRFDLVVSDVDMPRMNGLEFTKRIKADSRLHSIPVVIVSYKDREEDRLRGLDAGANCYLTKSGFHVESLLAAVENLIGAP